MLEIRLLTRSSKKHLKTCTVHQLVNISMAGYLVLIARPKLGILSTKPNYMPKWTMTKLNLDNMKLFRIISFEIAVLAIATGCNTTPRYQGDGYIKNTSYWADGVDYTTLYTIRLASFDMSTNVQREFNLGELSAVRAPTITVCIRFKDQFRWFHLAEADKLELKVAAENSWRDVDSLKSTFSYRLSNQSGTLLEQPTTLLKDYTWGGGQIDPEVGSEIEIRNSNQARTKVPPGSKLKLWVSYAGDPTLTNRGEFVVFWGWR